MRVVSSEVRYRNPWISVREDVLEYDDGSPGLFGVIEKPDFALVVPVEGDGFWMVEQWRHPVRRRGWEFPQGSFPPGYDGDARDYETMARTELAEETGLTAGTLTFLGRVAPNHGLVNHHMHVWLATDLTPGAPAREVSEADMVHAFVPRAEFAAMVRDGRCNDGATLSAWALLQLIGSP